ncbi:uncharacterized protein EDB91DRAFT_1245400 [Suillus paluster]|uniref:uncharacterized protein n=1 Tax=Suillus paluster TaxID=48578 RepID=UPI001B862331|nr:uncharacterized protein EDB91DRAFT_1245400 [Suillus paluster]KAG1747927.1 hypothetical protein EDB91DRAFT_1245400 [Suillus paluster]
MPTAPWTTKAQSTWLQEQLPAYIQQSTGNKDYFWPGIHKHWFKMWPEHDILFPDIPGDVPLTDEQTKQEVTAEQQRKVQLATWFHWRAGSSKKNCGLKKEQTVFDAALRPKMRAKSVEEIYMGMVYDEQIKPLIKAKQEAGNVTTSGHCIALGRRFSKELLEDESDEVKKEVKKRYDEQIKGSKGKGDILDDEDDENDESDPDAIAKGIDELLIICQRFARLVKKKTRFIVSFMCAGPDPRHNQDIVTLSCHPSETSSGRNFAHLYPDEDYAFLGAYQQFAESIFSVKEHDPLLPATTNVGDGNRSGELEDDGSGKENESSEEDGSSEEDEHREENEEGTDTMSWDDPLYTISQTPDASIASDASITPDASTAPDASMAGTVVPAGFADASLQLTGPFYSQSQYTNWSLDFHNVMMPQASAPLSSIQQFEAQFFQPGLTATGYLGSSTAQNTSFSSPASSGLSLADSMHGWNFNNGNFNSTGWCYGKARLPNSALDRVDPVWETSSLSSLLTSPTSTERSTTSPSLDEQLPQFAYQLPTLPAANPPSPTETAQPAEVPNSQAGTGRATTKSKSKSKLPTTKSLTAQADKPHSAAKSISDTPTVAATPTRAKFTPLVNSTEPIPVPVITLAKAAKPKAKPKPKSKPKATSVNIESSAVMEMMHVAADEGNTLSDSTTINNIAQKPIASQIGAARVSKRVPIKSRQNDIADAIRSDGLTFVGIGSKENPGVLEEVGGTSSKRAADSTAEGMIPSKKRRTKA